MRTLEEIKDEITTEHETQLPQVASGSASAIYKLWINVVSNAIFGMEQIFAKDQANLIDLTERRRYGTVNWYASECLKFQLGDQLIFNSTTGQFYYAEIDESLQIIKRSAVIEDSTSGELIIKVAKQIASELAPLETIERLAFKSYIEEIKVAGTNITVISFAPDTINISAGVFYDGNILLADLQATILSTLNDFKVNAPFNGVVLVNDIIEALRSIDGIDDVHFNNITGQSTGSTPVAFDREYATTSGYFVYEANILNTWTFTPRYQ